MTALDELKGHEYMWAGENGNYSTPIGYARLRIEGNEEEELWINGVTGRIPTWSYRRARKDGSGSSARYVGFPSAEAALAHGRSDTISMIRFSRVRDVDEYVIDVLPAEAYVSKFDNGGWYGWLENQCWQVIGPYPTPQEAALAMIENVRSIE